MAAGGGSKAGALAAAAGGGSTMGALAAAAVEYGWLGLRSALTGAAAVVGRRPARLAAAALGQPVSPTEALKGAARNKLAASVGAAVAPKAVWPASRRVPCRVRKAGSPVSRPVR